jgi:hypothetical protein
MYDLRIWTNRAAIQIDVAKMKAIDRGVTLDDLEDVVRKTTTHPFGSAAPGSPQIAIWQASLDEAFGVRKRRRPKGSP